MTISRAATFEAPGYLESGVDWIKRRIFFQKLSSDAAIKRFLQEGMTNRTVCPQVIFRYFEQFVSEPKKLMIYEQIGRKTSLPLYDRIMNLFWRSTTDQSKRWIEWGQECAKKDPYLLAPEFIQNI